jgi:hypothetical protein
MRVLLVREGPSARARTQAVATASARPEIQLGLARQGAPGGESVEREWLLGDRPARNLREAIAAFAPDLIHCHAPPASLTVSVNELTAGRIPVVHDAGSLGSNGDGSDFDRRAVEESAALIVPSQGLLEQVGARFILPPVTCVFPSYPLARELGGHDDRDASAEANVGRLASLYEQLVREPIVGVMRGR